LPSIFGRINGDKKGDNMNKSKAPKMIENKRGELVTQGHWYSATELERRDRAIAEQYYGIGAQNGIKQTSLLYRFLNVLSINIAYAFSIAMCGNSPATRSWAAQTLAEMKDNRKNCDDFWEQRSNLHALTIDADGFLGYMQFADEFIELLESYAANPDDENEPHTEQHAELRTYFDELGPEMSQVIQGRLTVVHPRKIELATKYIGEHALAYEEQHGKANNYLIGTRIYEELDRMLPENRERIEGAKEAYERLSNYCEMRGESVAVKDEQEEKLKKAIDNSKQAIIRT
jgi:hypothetical protein